MRASSRFLAQRLVEAFLHELGVAEDGGERRPQLVAHVGDELRLVLARDLELAAFLGDLLEQPRVLDGDHGLVGEGRERDQSAWRKGSAVRRCRPMTPMQASVSQQRHAEQVRRPALPSASRQRIPDRLRRPDM